MRQRAAVAEHFVLRIFALTALAVVVLASGCGGQKSATSGPTAPTPPTGGPPAPMPTGAVSGRVENPDIVADLITYNQAANVGLSIPVEGAIQRASGIITRWELPIPVYVDPSITGNCVGEALAYWQSVTGLTYVFVGADAEPRLTVRAAGSDELNISIGSGLVYRTYANNRARLGVVKILTSNASCSAPSALFRHELGHTLGIFGHPPWWADERTDGRNVGESARDQFTRPVVPASARDANRLRRVVESHSAIERSHHRSWTSIALTRVAVTGRRPRSAGS